jgi:thiol-disulfide isomerase/thioredoxin
MFLEQPSPARFGGGFFSIEFTWEQRHMPTARRLVAVPLLVAVCSLPLGCSHSDSENPSDKATPSGSVAATAKADTRQVTLSVAGRADYDALLDSLRGKVVLVDFWATWCGPCVKQFPHTVELYQQSDPDQLAVVSVSMDDPEDEEKVLEFLQARGASFHNLLSEYGISAEGFEAFEIDDGAVPHYKIYDRSGKLRHTASSGGEVDELIQQVLRES